MVNWGLQGTDRVYEEQWFRQMENKHALERLQLVGKVRGHYQQCLFDVKYLKETIWECIERNIK